MESFGDMTMASGLFPTAMALPAFIVARSMGVTVSASSCRHTPCSWRSRRRRRQGSSWRRKAIAAALRLRLHMLDIHIINRFKQGDARNSIPVEGIPGAYQVTFVLSRPGYSLVPEGSYSFSGGLEGDSHLAIAKPAFMAPGNENANEIVVVCATEDGHFVFRGVPNKSGFLGKLISEPFNANSRRDAEERAFRSLSPSLSNWTVHLDVPLEICQRETREIATDNIQTSIVTPHFRAPFSVLPTVQLPPEFRGLASLYREALNTSSVVYQFLCLYKIVEALRARRKRLQRAAKKSGTPCSSPIEVLPGTEKEIAAWLRSLFYARPDWDLFAIQSAVPVELRGQDMAFVIDSVLKPLRDQVAHALTTPKGDLTLSADELLHARQCTQAANDEVHSEAHVEKRLSFGLSFAFA